MTSRPQRTNSLCIALTKSSLTRPCSRISCYAPCKRCKKRSCSILQHCIEINRLENEGDFVYRSAIAKLFEKGDDTLEVLKWKEVYESIENAIDSCEDVANVIEGVALKNS
ncbi:MAG: DUF47 family protein [Deltaproteobacteria bacterium]|nr:MAG: DUF47 family protein [Deltaproteobacteria bacterium]